jgi:hypothetical protein
LALELFWAFVCSFVLSFFLSLLGLALTNPYKGTSV